jgi:hypothetical protein
MTPWYVMPQGSEAARAAAAEEVRSALNAAQSALALAEQDSGLAVREKELVRSALGQLARLERALPRAV